MDRADWTQLKVSMGALLVDSEGTPRALDLVTVFPAHPSIRPNGVK